MRAKNSFRTKNVLSKVLSQPDDDIGLTPPPSVSSNNVSREDVRKMMNEQKTLMDSNMRIQIRARKFSLISALLLIVFILGLMIGIVVYKDQRIRNLEFQNKQAIKNLTFMNEESFSDIDQRLKKLERKRITREEETRNERNVALNDLREEILVKIQEEIERSRKNESTSNVTEEAMTLSN